MPNTVRRRPFAVSTSSKDYAKTYTFNQVDFKGIFGGDNEIAIDQSTFADAKNVYIDDRLNLTSRPPVVRDGDLRQCLKEWIFGAYHLVYTRELALGRQTPGGDFETIIVDNPYDFTESEREKFSWRFRIKCISHKTAAFSSPSTLSEIYWSVSYDEIDISDVPKVNCISSKGHIFVWAPEKLYVFNTDGKLKDGERFLYFEDAQNYIYVPIHEQVVNGERSILEPLNELSNKRKMRYHYSLLSDIDFSGWGTVSRDVLYRGSLQYHLYQWPSGYEKFLIYPLASSVGNIIDMVQTPGGSFVFLRYNDVSRSIEISFNAKTFRQLPEIAYKGRPFLSRDGLCVFVFGDSTLLKYRVDAVGESTWEAIPYLEGDKTHEGISLSTASLEPTGYFLDEDNYAYFINCANKQFIYTHVYTKYDKLFVDAYSPSDDNSSHVKNFNNRVRIIIDRAIPGSVGLIAADGVKADDGGGYSGPIMCYYRGSWESGLKCAGTLQLSNYSKAEDIFNYGLSLTAIDVGENEYIRVVWYKPYYNSTYKHQYIGAGLQFDLNAKEIEGINITLNDVEYKVSSATSSLAINGQYAFGPYVANADRKDFYTIPINKTNAKPIYVDESSVWYIIGDTLWTSYLTDDALLFIDTSSTNTKYEYRVPDLCRELSDHYIVINDTNSSQLFISEERVVEGTAQLYLPASNTYKSVDKITNLWPLTDNIMGIFTKDELFYVSSITTDDGKVLYTKMMKSKTLIGCREGDEIIMGPDGKTILLPTPRGIAMLQASGLLDTSSQSITYLSDPIYHLYFDFYANDVMGTAYSRNGALESYAPMIKACQYRHLLLFYKYMDRDIFIFDTKNTSWWHWSVPYPIREMRVADYLYLWLDITFTPYELNQVSTSGSHVLPRRVPYFGTKFKFAWEFEDYKDDVIPGALSGIYTNIYENEFVGTRSVVQYATPRIDWYFTSQRLHFGQINNYKCVKSIGLMLKGDDKLQATLETRAYRDFYHPEYSDTFEIDVNELRTFIKRMNLMHLTNFQYTLKTSNEEKQIPLKLNSICIKYEVKEAIR